MIGDGLSQGVGQRARSVSLNAAMNRQAAFTLIELMVVVTLVALLALVGVPNFQRMVSDNRASSQANNIMASLQLARNEATRTRRPVTVCPSTNQESCATASDWDRGWIVFYDANESGTPAIDNTEQDIINVGQARSSGIATSGPARVRFRPTGMTEETTTVHVFTITPERCVSDEVRTIRVVPGGRANLQRTDCPS